MKTGKTTKTMVIAAFICAVLGILAGEVTASGQSATYYANLKGNGATNKHALGCGTALQGCVSVSDDSLERLLDAIATVESGGRAGIMGDNGRAVGMYQLHAVTVKDVNRRCGTVYKWPTDCLNPTTGREIARKYLLMYARPGATLETLARNYNGGPRGWQKAATEKYWQRVKTAIKIQGK
ncbi:MAG: transglycosylase SLT domain-containing protein [Clostridia bacterium]|jgi:hypothetical protein